MFDRMKANYYLSTLSLSHFIIFERIIRLYFHLVHFTDLFNADNKCCVVEIIFCSGKGTFRSNFGLDCLSF